MRVNDINDLENIIPEPCLDFPNFFYYPGDMKIILNRSGDIINLRSKKLLQQYSHPDGHKQISTLINNKRRTIKVHRLLALTFIGRPSRHKNMQHKKLEVNHIDGNRDNDALDNLEWVTGKENILHAHVNGLCSKDRATLAKSIDNGNIIHFNSVEACASSFDIPKQTLWKHLVKYKSGTAHKLRHIFKFDDGSDWIQVSPYRLKELGSGTAGIEVIVEDKENNKYYIFSNIQEASDLTKIPYNFISKKLKHKGICTLDNFVIRKV